MIKKNEVLIHECSKHGSIWWKNMPKCISDGTNDGLDDVIH